MSKLARAITPDEVAAYHNAGVVHLRGVLDLATVNGIRRCIDQAIQTLGESANGYDLTQLASAYESSDDEAITESSHGQHDVACIMQHMRASRKPLLYDQTAGPGNGSFQLDTAISNRIKDFRRFALRGPGAEIAAALLGSEKVRFFGDQIFVKEPNTRARTAFHQDATYFEIEGDQCCVLWIPVDPVPLENGAMVYLRGSHRDNKRYKPNVFVSQTPLPGAEGDDLPDIEGNPENFDLVHFEAEPGDVLVHHYLTVHGTGGNASRYQVRRAASIRYTGDDIRFEPRPWAPRQTHHVSKLRRGDHLDGPDFPVVWSRKPITTAA
jgi:ectoine hydroxylase-related dioxygenase (phytanoyl-CoA dioxygenase family)